MNDKTPNQDHSPESEDAARTAPQTTPTSSPDAPTVPVAPASDIPAAQTAQHPATGATAQSAPVPAAPAPKKSRRGWLIGGGIAAAVLLAGGGVAVGAAIGDEFGDDDDRPGFSEGPRGDEDAPDQGQRGGGPGDDRDEDRRDEGPSDGPVTGIGTDSADDLIDVANAARGAAEGEVTSIDAKRDGTWEVELTNGTGGETEVRVDAEGSATVISSDDEADDDTAPAYVLDDAALRALVAAALDEADGLITDLDVDDDAASPYDARVVSSDRRSVDIDFSADFAVVGTDTDD
ncbi:hypothetical protein [Microbacterium hydrocarbonoxydans]|uniref:hypothetical protein n=1 Tax=Microbacterium hydrocarbonoxydans TaxID=273678 RepID=UPI002041943F|nr:hypothetical protein [Microbacterium hydrocarbonoxydans]MCM3778706.1 hypothetical protein [Microbacterium hydrocarbonoxydans]